MKLSRRWFLQGAGATLAIPLLPSLLSSREARAQEAQVPKYFVNLATHHGAAWEQRLFPSAPSTGVEKIQHAGREIRRFALVPTTTGAEASLSSVLTASASALTASLAQKMLVLRGLDVPFYLGHHTGGHLGNFARNDGNGSDGRLAQTQAARRTIDQIMAWSPAFYPDLGGVRERALVLSQRTSYNYANPVTRSGEIQEVGPQATRPIDLFNLLFPSTTPTTRKPLVDRVLEDYKRLRNSARISSADKARLDDYIQRIHELQRRMGTVVDCAAPSAPPEPYASASAYSVSSRAPWAQNPPEQTAWFRTVNDILVAAFSCGVTRVAVGLIDPTLSSNVGDWHQDIAHTADAEDGAAQGVLCESYQTFFRDVLIDLATKMDGVQMPNGKTLLDQSLVAWTQESGQHTHKAQDLPVVTFGSAGGFLTTGYHCDYRNLSARLDDAQTRLIEHPGLLWHQWLGTVLQAMGIPKSEWENPAVNSGYPDYNFARLESWDSLTAAEAWPTAVWNDAGQILPWLKA